MNTGPLRRTTGTIGLIALTPVAAMLALGMLSAEEAAVRAVIVAVLVVVLGRLAQGTLRRMLHRVERTNTTREAAAESPTETGATPLSRRRGEQSDRRAS